MFEFIFKSKYFIETLKKKQEITSIKRSSEPPCNRKKLFHKKALYLPMHTDFKADNEIDISDEENKTTNLH